MIGSRNWSAVWKFEIWFVEKKKWKNFQTTLDKIKNNCYIWYVKKLNPSGLIEDWNFGITLLIMPPYVNG